MARAMKDSGIAWIGEIPEEWERVKIGFLYSFSSGNTLTALDFDDDGQYAVYGANGLRGRYNNSNVHGKHILIGRVGAQCGNIHLVDGDIWVTEHALISERLTESVEEEYAAYLLEAMNLGQYASGTAQPVIAAEKIRKLYVPLPSIDEQKRIVNCLDAECVRIDAVIEQTRASIEEYKKLKQAVITQAVTKGIRPNRPMKDSGVEWIKQVPADWNVIPSKYIFRDSDQRRQDGDEQLTASQQHGIISQERYIELTGSKVVFANKGHEDWKHVEPYDFIISLRSFQGGLEMSETTGCITWHYIVLKPCKEIYSYYFKWLFKSELYIKALRRTCNYIRDGQDLRYSNFVQVPLVEPGIKEQEEIAMFLNDKIEGIAKLIKTKERYLSELEKYKESMIFEYVTGKREIML